MSPERSLRVLQVAPATTGGIGEHVRVLTVELLRQGHTVTVVAPAETLARLDVATLGAHPAPMRVGKWRGWFPVRRRLRALARHHDVTHGHGARVGAQLSGAVAPLIVTWHNAPLGGAVRRAVHLVLERLAARHSDVVLCASADLVVRARRAGARDARLCELAAPGRRPSTVSRASRPRDERPTVLAIARLHPQKRLDLLIDAASSWSRRADAPQVLIAGDGPLAAGLRAKARAARAPVTFLGPRSDIDVLLGQADVIVLPSDWEARPFVAQEALRAGVPLVATDVGGVRDLVGDAAVLVPAGDADALRAAIERVLQDPALRRRLRDAGPQRAAGWPSAEEMAHEIEQVYLDLIRRSSPHRP